MTKNRYDPFWGYLIHLGFHMFTDWTHERRKPMPLAITRGDPTVIDAYRTVGPDERLACDRKLWDELVDRMAEVGVNVVLIDLGEGVRYESHPELAVEGSWTQAELREALARIRDLGMEPIPKLNFSAGHDAWLGDYSRMVSTPVYYEVCSDLIAEVCDLFDRPRFFHLGMDEETAGNQWRQLIAVTRQHHLWWDDLRWLADQVVSRGSRPWIWADMWWIPGRWRTFPDEPIPADMLERKDIIHSNWHYGDFSPITDASPFPRGQLESFAAAEAAGFDQVPTGSNFRLPYNLPLVARCARETIAPERLLGILQAPWRKTIEPMRELHLEALEAVRKARRVFEEY